MADVNYWDRVRDRAYFKHLERINHNIPDNPNQDWDDAVREQSIDERIRDEAFLHYLGNGGDSHQNWLTAYNEIMARLNFLAFSLHESDINRSPIENWINAQKLYLEKF